MKVLGTKVNEVDREQAINKISGWVRGRRSLKHVVTVYSEFLLTAMKDDDFRKAVEKADLVVPDGVGVLAAMEYLKREPKGLVAGLEVGFKGVRGDLNKPVTGVWLFEELVRLAADQGWRVFLLGGFGDTVDKLAVKLINDNPGLNLEFDAGEQRVGGDKDENGRIVGKINGYKPDLLMVAYGPVAQEKWIYDNKKRLKAKVAIGLGGTFDEVLGRFPRAPKWMEKRGLKALWRLVVQPKRLPRIFRGMVVFPWKVFVGVRNSV
jgi:N-acetylglucosaminyldiphosphoundecaprenol N-acetyl-beta-D-mannosaminyltransferase